VDHAVVFLVPIGTGRYELFLEPPDDEPAGSAASAEPPGFFQRVMQRTHSRWHEAVRGARTERPSAGVVARLRDRAVCATAEAIAEQRTLWMLRHAKRVTLVHPSDLSASQAAAERDRMLSEAAAHHLRWLIVDGLAFAASGVFVLIPGPNLIAYYFLFRVVGHLLSWRGVRRAASVRWEFQSEPALAELGGLAELPREARASRVDAIAARLRLPSLAAFFDRTAVPARS
jgi:K+-H+ exchange-related protein